MKFYYLQVARFFAALAVVFFHTLKVENAQLAFLIDQGSYAVSFFFLLSGFVITYSLVRKPINFPYYLFRRLQKIMPQWLLSMAISLLVAGGLNISLFRLAFAALLLQALVPAYSNDVNFIGWSLSVELVMYIVLYAVVAGVNIYGRGFRSMVWIVWAISQAGFIYLVTQPSAAEQNRFFFLFYHPVWHLNSFLWGILFCVYYLGYKDRVQPTRRSGPLLVGGYFVLLVLAFLLGHTLGVPRFYHDGFLAPLTGALVLGLSIIEANRTPSSFKLKYFDPVANTLGGISFGIYLFHMPLYYWMSPLLPIDSEGPMYLLYLGAVLLLSWISYQLLDLYLHRKTAFIGRYLQKAAWARTHVHNRQL